MTGVWVIVSIGCIECGVDNENPVEGVFADEKSARKAMRELRRAEQKHGDKWSRFPNMQPRDQPNGFGTGEVQYRLVRVTVGEFNPEPPENEEEEQEPIQQQQLEAPPDPSIMALIRERFNGESSGRWGFR